MNKQESRIQAMVRARNIDDSKVMVWTGKRGSKFEFGGDDGLHNVSGSDGSRVRRDRGIAIGTPADRISDHVENGTNVWSLYAVHDLLEQFAFGKRKWRGDVVESGGESF